MDKRTRYIYEIKNRRIEKVKESSIRNGYTHKTKGTTGFKFSEESKRKMIEKRLGKSNGSYNKHWYTDGKKNILSKDCPEGFYLGRTISYI